MIPSLTIEQSVIIFQGLRSEVDRQGWAEGPWDHEPDQLEWLEQGVYCCLSRQRVTGRWQGYIALPETHLWHKSSYRSLNKHFGDKLPAHGGVSYSRFRGSYPFRYADVSKEHWIIGYNCGHLGDLQPGIQARNPDPLLYLGLVYRNLSYNLDIVKSLVEFSIISNEYIPQDPNERSGGLTPEVLKSLGFKLHKFSSN
jgi:hypothetical protein